MNRTTIQPPPNQLLHTFNGFLSRQIGLFFQAEKWAQFRKGITAAAEEFGFTDTADCIKWLMKGEMSKDQIETLATHLTISETYFFRGTDTFAVFEHKVLPRLLENTAFESPDNIIRIWSAACSTGEEAYSIAMIMDRNRNKLKNIPPLILGTDINRKAINKARNGIFRKWSFRVLPPSLQQKHFTPDGPYAFKAGDHLRNMVVFDYLNLVEGTRPRLLENTPGANVIFCRNVLMYFDKETARRVLDNLLDCLQVGGWLIVTASDAFNVDNHRLLRTDISGVPIFRKIAPLSPQSPAVHSPVHYQRRVPAAPSITHKEIDTALNFFKQGLYAKTLELLQPMDMAALPCPKGNCKSQAEIQYTIARCHQHLGQWQKAETWCNKAIQNDKHHILYRYLLACILLELDNPRDAAVMLRQCLYLDHNFIPALYHIGKLAHRQKKISEAVHYFNKALQRLDTMNPKTEITGMGNHITAGKLTEIIKKKMEINGA